MVSRGAPYVIAEQVEVTVEKTLPYAVFVRMKDGSIGYVHRRDVSWGGSSDPRQLVTVGQTVSAIVIELPTRDQSLRLSLKAVIPDPWESFIEKHETGQLIRGIVKSLEPFGVFIEIVPGVDGLITRDQLALQPVDKPEDIVWVGDQVEAIITYIDHKERRIRLSMRQRIRQINEAAEVWQRIQTIQTEVPDYDPEADTTLDNWPIPMPKLGPVFILDDEIGICEPLVQHLRHLGYEAEGAMNLESARDALSQRSYAVLLVDIQIHWDDGLQFVAEMAKQLANTEIVVMSDSETLAAHSSQIEALNVIAVLPKPLDTDEIVDILRQIEAGEVETWRPEEQSAISGVPDIATLTTSLPADTTTDQRLHKILMSLIETTHAQNGIIFQLARFANTTSIVTQIGNCIFNDGALYSLHQSPVGDVVREQQPVIENSADTIGKLRFEKLLALFPFGSCIGVPIPTQSSADYALFIFHRDRKAFHKYRMRDAMASATLLATVIEQDQFAKRMQQLNALLLTGQVATGLHHEINNKLSSINLSVSCLQEECSALQNDNPGLSDSVAYNQMQKTLVSVLKTIKGLRKTVSLFQQLMAQDEEGAANVNRAIQQALKVATPLARYQHIEIKTDIASNLPTVVGNTTALHQVLLNLILNAVQQIPTVRNRNGLISIESKEIHTVQKPIVRILVTDNGPGIHRKLWEKVFLLGYTSRTDGSGQGLYIARSLVEMFGGTIKIESSPIHLGTTFQIEIPICGKGSN
ncbi:MAG: hypothetical protein CL608_28705 [Anaerolineaceae bacterium]|nr:hypothetical protein [Anaerolineaceae bacterium]